MLSGHYYYILFILQNITSPLQGFFNFIVYIRPYVQIFSIDYPDLSFGRVFLKAIQSKGDEQHRRPTRRRRSLADRLRDPNYSKRGLTSREIHFQQVAATILEDNDVEKDAANQDKQIDPLKIDSKEGNRTCNDTQIALQKRLSLSLHAEENDCALSLHQDS